MAVGLIFQGTGVTQEQYDQVFNQVTDNGTSLPPGAILHRAGPSEQGFCVVEVWESREAVMRFYQEQLGQALAAANITVQPTLFDIVNAADGNAATA